MCFYEIEVLRLKRMHVYGSWPSYIARIKSRRRHRFAVLSVQIVAPDDLEKEQPQLCALATVLLPHSRDQTPADPRSQLQQVASGMIVEGLLPTPIGQDLPELTRLSRRIIFRILNVVCDVEMQIVGEVLQGALKREMQIYVVMCQSPLKFPPLLPYSRQWQIGSTFP